MPTPDAILAVLKEGLAAWKTFIATREEAYKRKRDKEQVAAIEAAEKYIFTNEELVKQSDPATIKKLQKNLTYFRTRFFKFH